eukprot:7644557-Lingulodinium_polyedra.AAC.1
MTLTSKCCCEALLVSVEDRLFWVTACGKQKELLFDVFMVLLQAVYGLHEVGPDVGQDVPELGVRDFLDEGVVLWQHHVGVGHDARTRGNQELFGQ